MFLPNYKKLQFKNYFKKGLSLLTSFGLFFVLGDKIVRAQQSITPDNTTNTIVTPNGNEYNISGGESAGNNIFHSFEKFGLTQVESANFSLELNGSNINNIFGRITGGEASVINGSLTITGGTPNLFFINPAGIIFGKDSSINVPASFTATTANGVQFGSSWFYALGDNNYDDLVGEPSGFAFLGVELGSIINAGNINVGLTEDLDLVSKINLVGGTVINTGTLKTPGGTINIVAVPEERLVTITPEGSLLSIVLETEDKTTLQEGIGSNNVTPASLAELLTGGGIAEANAIEIVDGVIRLTASGTETPNEVGTAIASGNIDSSDLNIEAGNNLLFDRNTLVETNNNNPKFIGSLIEPENIDSDPGRPLEDIPIFQNLTLKVDPPSGQIGTLDIQGSFAVTNELLLENTNGNIIIRPQLPQFIDFTNENLEYKGFNGSLFVGIESLLLGVEPHGDFRQDSGSATINARQGSVELLRGITLNADTDLNIVTQRLIGSGTTNLLGNGPNGEPGRIDSDLVQTYTIGFISFGGLNLDTTGQEISDDTRDITLSEEADLEPELQLVVGFNPDNPNLEQPQPIVLAGEAENATGNVEIFLLSDQSFEVGEFNPSNQSGIASIARISRINDNGSLLGNVSPIEETLLGNDPNSLDEILKNYGLTQEQISESSSSSIAKKDSSSNVQSQQELATNNNEIALEIKSDFEVATTAGESTSNTESSTEQSATGESSLTTTNSSSSNGIGSSNNSASRRGTSSNQQSQQQSGTTSSSSTSSNGTGSNNNSANQTSNGVTNQASSNTGNQTNSNTANQANSNTANQANSNTANQTNSNATSESSSNTANQSNSDAANEASSNSSNQANSSSASQASSNSGSQANSSSANQASSNSGSQANSNAANQANSNAASEASNAANQANTNAANLPASKTSPSPQNSLNPFSRPKDNSTVALLPEESEANPKSNPIKDLALPIAGGLLLTGGAGTLLANAVFGNSVSTVASNILNSLGSNALGSNPTLKPEPNTSNSKPDSKSNQENPQQDNEIEMETTIEPGIMQLSEFPLLDLEISLELEPDSGIQTIHIKDNFVDHDRVEVKSE